MCDTMTIDRRLTLDTLRDLIRIDSRNPALETGAPGERELAAFVERHLTDLGWAAELHDLGERRANVVAVRPGAGKGPSLMINVHLDTVGVEGMAAPFVPRTADGRVYGRGAQDTKGGMAAVLAAARLLAETGPALAGDVVLAFVADEEHESLGTSELLRRVRTDAAIVIEPTDLDVCVAHRGFGVYRLTTRGRAAHGGDAEAGIDANLHMGSVLVALDRLRDEWGRAYRHALLRPAGLHVPRMAGGRELFRYADECVIDLECRTVPGQTADGVLTELQAIVADVASRAEDFDGRVEPVLWRGPYEIDPDRPIVRTVRTAAGRVRGEPAALIGHPWWEDAGLLGEAGIDAVVLGPRGGGLHTDEEWVDADSVIQMTEILYDSLISYCGVA